MTPFKEFDIRITAKGTLRSCDESVDMQRLRERVEWALNGTNGILVTPPRIDLIFEGESND